MCEGLESLDRLSDETVVARVNECASGERQATARLLALLGELDRRRLYLGLGFSSLFSYCTGHLHLSERAAYGRIEAARLVRRFPIVLRLVADGSVSLTAVALLGRYMTAENHRALLTQATHRTTREIEQMVAALCPQAARASIVRRVPASKPVMVVTTATPGPLWPAPTSGIALDPAAPQSGPRHASTARPVFPPRAALPAAEQPPPSLEERYRVNVTISTRAHAELMRARDLLRHAVPSGDVGLVLERAISLLMADLEKKKLARVARPRGGEAREGGVREGGARKSTGAGGEGAAARASGAARTARTARLDTRYIPAIVRREVWRRDRGRCAFVGQAGRCRERGFLELHHVVPFAAGGLATTANIELRCRAHNAHEAQVHFAAVRAP